MGKMKGHVLESVAWDKANRFEEKSTSSILVGTTTGLIFEALVEVGSCVYQGAQSRRR
jgi:hypothetical protein